MIRTAPVHLAAQASTLLISLLAFTQHSCLRRAVTLAMSSADELAAIHADLRERLAHFLEHAADGTFASAICSRIRITDIATTGFKLDEDGYAEASRQATCTVTAELEITPDMSNATMVAMHGGCGATLLDICSSMPIYALARGDRWQTSGVSSDVCCLPARRVLIRQMMIRYVSPSTVGDTLRYAGVRDTLADGAVSCPPASHKARASPSQSVACSSASA